MSDSGSAALSDVRFERVTKRYGKAVAVKALSLAIPRGSFFSLLGPSGCGKTTTLRLIAGFETPDEGDVFIRDTRVTETAPYRRDFAMVFQNFALFPHLTVADNVAFGLRMSGVAREERAKAVEAALAMVKLTGFAERYPKQLSGGQQQRVAIARAIVMKPAVLLLDEPLGALDKNLRESMQVELRSLQRELGLTTVFVTHDQEEALTMSDSIAVMRDGVIEQLGAPREIYERPATEFVATFLGASNLIDATVVESGNGSSQVEATFGRFTLAGSHPAGERLRLAIRPERVLLKPGRDSGALPAIVRDVVYRGMSAHVFLESGGLPLLAFVQNAASAAIDWSPGQEVGIVLPAESLVRLNGGAQAHG
ncbi:ABC transporter ATP-binding protein [Bosea sp. BK604]|uniref:ABC transporter ATP-binding protein n=1 Tax=Bosea sp. BK604 TaxID=2512180 RepID=UPI001046AB88|nr:ABC transporter ATP-binding protein [Bosea sp. BK604]TCR67555.1 putative spermidine/putrescine transport system ATP-binding protein/spermidine/putrescine transport system ATP-binding protein [Bosea sp. BK604]